MSLVGDLFRHNGIVSADGKLAGVVSLPRDQERLKLELIPLLVHAGVNEVAVRVGVLDKYTVYAVDLYPAGHAPQPIKDEHQVIPMLAQALDAAGCQALDEEVGPETIWALAHSLVSEQLADVEPSPNGNPE